MTDTGSLEFRVLGPVEVGSPGQRVDTGHARQRAVLAVLILELGRVVPTELLIDRIWGDDPPATVRNVVYSYVARLKAAIADAGDPAAALRRRTGGYVLDAPVDHCDLHRFRALVAEAAAAGDDEQAEALLRDAVSLWRGPALAGLSGAWLAAMRDNLELERRAALIDLNDIALRQGRHGVLISELSEAATAHPADERLIGQLMLALYRSGRQADALRWFEQTRRRLADDFGADPGPELQARHQQILRLDPALAAPVPVVVVSRADAGDQAEQATREQRDAAADPATVPRELPPDIGAFTGRAAELAELDRLLASPTVDGPSAVVISAVSGTAGVGKTALAVRWAHRAASHFPDGQLYVNLRGYDPGQPVPAAEALAGFLRSLGLPGQDIPADVGERAARYRTLMAQRRMLVVLDNASEAEQVRLLLPGAPGCRVLVTSRDTLAGLVALDGAQRLELELLPQPEAIALLRTLIGTRVDADLDAAAVLAAHCARLPLALRVAAELAAGRPESPLAELADELTDLQRRLELLDAGGDPRAAVRAVFSWSYRNLDTAAAALFRLLGTEPGPDVDSYAAAALAGTSVAQARPVLARLARAHLIQPAGPGRYGLHDLLRAYARDLARIQDSEVQHSALTRLFDHYLHTTATANGVLFPAEQYGRPVIPRPATDAPPLPDPATARAWLDAQLASLASTAAHAAAHGWPGHATRLAAHLFSYLDTGGHYTLAIAIHTSALNAAQRVGDQAAEATALTDLAAVSMRQGRWQQAEEFLEQVIVLTQTTGNLNGQARALGNLGLVLGHQGRLKQSTACIERAFVIHRATGSVVGQIRGLTAMGSNERQQGRYQPAASLFQEALALAREAGDRTSEALALEHFSVLELQRDHIVEAGDLLQRALALYRETGDRIGEAYTLVGLGKVAFRQGRYQEAADLTQRCLAFCRQAGDRNGEADALNTVGEILLATGQPAGARTQHAAALSLASQTRNGQEQARAHSGLGGCYHAWADLAQARRHWEQALELYVDLGAPQADQLRAMLDAAALSA